MDYYASHNICKNLPFVKDYIHVYFFNHEGWNTSFLVCLSFLLSTVLEKKPVYEGGGVKWFLRYLIFFCGTEEFLDQLCHLRCPQHQSRIQHADQWKKIGKHLSTRKSFIDKSSD